MKDLDLMVTMWPTFPHFEKFASDGALSGIRLNSAMTSVDELKKEFELARGMDTIPLWFDVKGRQLRITKVYVYKDRLELDLNHPISVETPTMVLFKAGADHCLLRHVEGNHLVFEGGPAWMVIEGESLHIRHHSLEVHGPTFLDVEIEKMRIAKESGFSRFFLSYVESQRDVDEFREFVGKDAEIILKIENQKGLDFVCKDFKKDDRTHLMAACGDLYVELERPHDILNALKLIIEKDPEASVGSRMMLSVSDDPVPSLADFAQLAWLYDVGYRTMMLCDEICLKEELLSVAVGALDAFKQSYCKPVPRVKDISPGKNWFSRIFTA